MAKKRGRKRAGLGATRKIGGQTRRLTARSAKKSNANKIAKRQRAKGKNCSVVKFKKGYGVYCAGSKKRKRKK